MQTKSHGIREAGACCAGLGELLSPELFQALADPSRLAILLELAQRGGAASVSEMGQCCPRDLSVVSRHLSRLRGAGAVVAERRGKEVRYSLAPGLGDQLRAIADALDACCPPQDRCVAATESPKSRSRERRA